MTDRTCERCKRKHVSGWVYLELDTIDNTWHQPGDVPPERSQGLFPFGASCAKTQLSFQELKELVKEYDVVTVHDCIRDCIRKPK